MVWRKEDPQGNEAAKCRFDVVPFMGSANLDLGCGPSKVWPHFVGVDNMKETELFGIAMRPELGGSCERMPQLASEGWDCVFSSHLLEHIEDYKSALAEWFRLVKPGGHLVLYLPHRDLYPRIGEEGANPDHKHDFAPEDILAAMREVASGWDCLVNETRSELREYSFFQVYRKLEGARAGEVHESYLDPKPARTVAIVRPGGLGDALFGAAVAAAYKQHGYHVTLYTGPNGRDVLAHDPNIDRIILMPNGMLDDEEMILYFLWESRKYSRFVNLIGIVEGRLLPHPNEIAYYWPDEVRRATMNANYHEAMFAHTDFPLGPGALNQRFYPTERELAWAREQRAKLFPNGKLVVIQPTGSGGPKTWPHVQRFLEIMAEHRIYTIVLGDIRVKLDPPEPYAVVMGRDLPIRLAMTLAAIADVVVGAESGIVNSVASSSTPKVVFMSHSSAQNLTKHYKRTAALEPVAIKCHPCHRLHRNFEFCTRDRNTGWAACQAAIAPELAAGAVLEFLRDEQAKAKAA